MWFGLAYVFGEILGLIAGRFALLPMAAAAVLWNIGVYYSGRTRKKRRVTRLQFFVLPVFMMLGLLRLTAASEEVDTAWKFGQNLPKRVEAQGCVIKIEEKTKVDYLYIRLKRGESSNDLWSLCRPHLGERQVLLAAADKSENIGFGDTVFVTGEAKPFETAGNPGGFDAWETYSAKGVYYEMFPENIRLLEKGSSFIPRLLTAFKEKLTDVYKKVLSEREAGMVCGMILGDKQNMPADLKELYQSQGIGHLFAISGLHMSMAGMGAFRLLRKSGLGLKLSFVSASVLMTAYGWICGMPDSCIRAVMMAALSMSAEILGRTYDSLSALFLAAVVILWQRPLALTGFGFLMSFGAVWALVGFCPTVYQYAKGAGKKVLPGLCITLITTPVICRYLYEIPVYSPVLNFFILPLMGILFPLAAAGGVIGLVCLPAGRFLMGLVHCILAVYETACRFFSGLPCSGVITGRTGIAEMIIVWLICAGIYILAVKKRKSGALIFGIVFLIAEYAFLGLPRFPDGVRIVFADVGQGDCALLSMGDGTNWLIDGGSSSEKNVGKYTIEKLLKYYGVRKLDGVFLSHMDGDHTNGITELMENGFPIENVYFPEVCPSEEKAADIAGLAKRVGIETKVMRGGSSLSGKIKGEKHAFFEKRGRDLKSGTLEWKLSCLHPDKDFETFSDNDASMMLLLELPGFNVLFTGDGERMAEAAAADRLKNIDLLKVGHHGSKNSSGKEFLGQIRPKAAVISCGRDNSYGHPHREVLERLKEADCRYFITAFQGAVLVEYNAGRADLRTWLSYDLEI